MGAVRVRREEQPAVVTLAAVVIPGAVNLVAVRIKDPAQPRVVQTAAAGSPSLKVDLVLRAGRERDLEPVDVLLEIDLTRGRTPDRHPPSGAAVGRVRVGILRVRDVDDRQLVLASCEALAAGRDVVGAVRVRRELHPGGVAGATTLAVRGVVKKVAVRIVDRDDLREERDVVGAVVAVVNHGLKVDPVGPALLQFHREPVVVEGVGVA